MRASRRIGLLIAALVILAVGIWFGVRSPSLPRGSFTYYGPMDTAPPATALPIYDQLPLRIGVAVVASSIATILVMVALPRSRPVQGS
jgi:hypothetical protein